MLLETISLVFFCSILIIVGVYIQSMIHQLDVLKFRVHQLSNSCQIAEIQSGLPYFTSLGYNVNQVENTEVIYEVLNEKIKQAQSIRNTRH